MTENTWVAERGFRDAMSGGEHTTIEDDFITIFCSPDNFDPDKSDYFEVRGPNQNDHSRLLLTAPDGLALAKRVVEYFGEGVNPDDLDAEKLDCDAELLRMALALIKKAAP